MSIMRVKSKVTPSYCSYDKDLQATTHSFRYVNARSSTQSTQSKGSTISHSNLTQQNVIRGKQIGINSYTINQNGRANSTLLNPFDLLKTRTTTQIQVSQFSPTHYSQPNTPKSKSKQQSQQQQQQQQGSTIYMAEFRKKVIKDLSQINTIQSKCMMSATPNQMLQESEIVFKGSRDVAKMMPMKLIYQDQVQFNNINNNQINQSRQKCSEQQSISPQINFKMIKQSNNFNYLVVMQPSMLTISLIKLSKSFTVQHIMSENLLPVYFKHRVGSSSTYLFCQPYQYTLDQLLRYKIINKNNIKIVCKHLEQSIKTLCDHKFNYFQIQGIEKNVYYIQGKFKLLPIFHKGKVCAMRNYEKIVADVSAYLHQQARNYQD